MNKWATMLQQKKREIWETIFLVLLLALVILLGILTTGCAGRFVQDHAMYEASFKSVEATFVDANGHFMAFSGGYSCYISPRTAITINLGDNLSCFWLRTNN